MTQRLSFNFKIPEGYIVDFVPEPLRLLLPEDIGDYTYSIRELGGSIQITMRFNLLINEIPVSKYPELRNFFKIRVAKENEKIVLKKA